MPCTSPAYSSPSLPGFLLTSAAARTAQGQRGTPRLPKTSGMFTALLGTLQAGRTRSARNGYGAGISLPNGPGSQSKAGSEGKLLTYNSASENNRRVGDTKLAGFRLSQEHNSALLVPHPHLLDPNSVGSIPPRSCLAKSQELTTILQQSPTLLSASANGLGVTRTVSGATALLCRWSAPRAEAMGYGLDPEPLPGPDAMDVFGKDASTRGQTAASEPALSPREQYRLLEGVRSDIDGEEDGDDDYGR
ncbi:hypothetical protein TREES_T100007319 [Tupaia chinensis]|uniref:Uncharacterized protein n=1 Tax=Tupaia chinensis TaxID=246437 RepID=L9L4D6_TUPCH|nr:hypothetical protein TREES_T100007319 [Tupaia chinensis]